MKQDNADELQPMRRTPSIPIARPTPRKPSTASIQSFDKEDTKSGNTPVSSVVQNLQDIADTVHQPSVVSNAENSNLKDTNEAKDIQEIESDKNSEVSASKSNNSDDINTADESTSKSFSSNSKENRKSPLPVIPSTRPTRKNISTSIEANLNDKNTNEPLKDVSQSFEDKTELSESKTLPNDTDDIEITGISSASPTPPKDTENKSGEIDEIKTDTSILKPIDSSKIKTSEEDAPSTELNNEIPQLVSDLKEKIEDNSNKVPVIPKRRQQRPLKPIDAGEEFSFVTSKPNPESSQKECAELGTSPKKAPPPTPGNKHSHLHHTEESTEDKSDIAPSRLIKKTPPMIPKRPSPGIPPRPPKLISSKIKGVTAGFDSESNDTNTKPSAPLSKPKPPPKPINTGGTGKVSGLRASLFNDLNNVILRGGMPPPAISQSSTFEDKEEEKEEEEEGKSESKKEETAHGNKLGDARRGRARGPKRKLPAVKPQESIVTEEDKVKTLTSKANPSKKLEIIEFDVWEINEITGGKLKVFDIGEQIEAIEEKQRLERERLEKERLEKERLEKERLEKERLEKERLEKERLEKERLEQERLEKERLEKERIEKERIEKERLEKERLEKEQLEKERLEKERLEQDRLEKERIEKEKAEKERIEKMKAEKEALRLKLEQEIMELERAEAALRKEAEEKHTILTEKEEPRLTEVESLPPPHALEQNEGIAKIENKLAETEELKESLIIQEKSLANDEPLLENPESPAVSSLEDTNDTPVTIPAVLEETTLQESSIQETTDATPSIEEHLETASKVIPSDKVVEEIAKPDIENDINTLVSNNTTETSSVINPEAVIVKEPEETVETPLKPAIDISQVTPIQANQNSEKKFEDAVEHNGQL